MRTALVVEMGQPTPSRVPTGLFIGGGAVGGDLIGQPQAVTHHLSNVFRRKDVALAMPTGEGSREALCSVVGSDRWIRVIP